MWVLILSTTISALQFGPSPFTVGKDHPDGCGSIAYMAEIVSQDP